MKFSVTIAQGTEGWKIAKRAEELGFYAAWFEDSQMVAADPFVVMAVAAVNTSKIELGTGVLIPSNRIAPQTANSLASLNNLAPGRINMGIGTGFSGRRSMGLDPVRMKDMRAYVEVVDAFLHQQTIEWEFEAKKRKIRFLNPDKDLINLTDPIDIYIGAQGPKTRRMAAELKTHWMSMYSSLGKAAADYQDMQQARLEVGTSPEAFKNSIFITGYPLAEGEPADSPRAKRQAGPLAATWLHNVLESQDYQAVGARLRVDKTILEKYRRVYEAYQPADARYLSLHRGHALFLREEEAEFITADWIRRSTMTGPVSELRERIRELKNIGYHEVSFVMNTLLPADIDMLERWAEVMEGV
ncbi:MAG: LLM class flavin-dependent oxidoreductase [Georgfuchsia sp.]